MPSAKHNKTAGSRLKSKSKPAPKPKVKVGDAAVSKATGKSWDEWFKILDRAGCEKMNHKQIVAVLVEQHGVGPWWQQMVTVGYEQARGMRELHEKATGDFAVSGNKTVAVPVMKLFEAFHDARLRARWLGSNDGITIRKAMRPKSLRITWCDGRTNLDVNLYPKGVGKSAVSLDHRKLRDSREAAKMKRYWAATLQKLKLILES